MFPYPVAVDRLSASAPRANAAGNSTFRWLEPPAACNFGVMERVCHKQKSFAEATAREIREARAMTPAERVRIAHALRRRAFSKNAPDVRACHRER